MYEFYREAIIGKALQEAIEEKLKKNELSIAQAKIILEKYDAAIPEVFQRTVQTTISFKGVVSSYNHVDGVWKFSTKNFVMTVNNEMIRSEFVKIVACDADTNMESGRRRRKKSQI